MLAVAGKDFSIVAGDTRMSTGFNIKSRNVTKIYTINQKTVLGTGGAHRATSPPCRRCCARR